MKHFTFTEDQLFAILKGIPERFREYILEHGYKPERGAAQAANDTIEGLIAEQKKVDAGETCFINQVYPAPRQRQEI